MANGNFGGGSGTLSDPYLVEDGADLRAMSRGIHYKQVKNIDLSDYPNWEPITNTPASYNGGGYTINNLNVPTNISYFSGLFRSCPGVVENLDIVNAFVRNNASHSTSQTGILASSSVDSIINNVSVSGEVVSASNATGGLVGSSSRTYISNSTSHCSVSGVDNVGCLIGSSSDSDIVNCRVEDDSALLTGLSSIGRNYVGGMIGHSGSDRVLYCSSIVTDITGEQGVGGLIGRSTNTTSINDCESYGGYVVGSARVGGLIGEIIRSSAGSTMFIENVISRGVNVEGQSHVGGLIGSIERPGDVLASWCYIYYPRIVRTRGSATTFYDLCPNWTDADNVPGGSGFVVDNLEFYSRV